MENSNLTLCTNNKGESENKSVDIPKEKGSDKVEGDVKSSEEEAPVSKKKSLGGARGPMSIDLSNPEFLKPFDHGWVREVVYRSRMDTSQRRHADVYYYTPLGKKVRFSRETLDYLSDDTLTLDNFTFYPREIGVDDPTKEIVREARSKNGPPEARRLKVSDSQNKPLVSTY